MLRGERKGRRLLNFCSASFYKQKVIMKSMFQYIAAALCAVALVACGGGTKKAATVIPAQPDFKIIDNVLGTGTVAATGDLLVVNYTGYLYDATKSDFKGAKFDSSVDRGTPYSFTVGVGAVIVGWDQGLLGMKVGGKRTLIIPQQLAYGANKRDALPAVNGNTYAAIPAYAPLVFDVELVSVQTATTPVVVPPPTSLETLDLSVGTGDTITTDKTVYVYYTGWLYEGTRIDLKGAQFDTNVGGTKLCVNLGSANAASPCTTVITGFAQGMNGMKVGGKRRITIPPSLGYGANGQGTIPGNATLIFEVTLDSVK